MPQCCHVSQQDKKNVRRFDYLLWGSTGILILVCVIQLLAKDLVHSPHLTIFFDSAFELLSRMWWGVALGIAFVGILEKIPRAFVISLLGRGGTFQGILRATGAGILLDLCSHGILLVGMKLYERGASLGQVMAFLIASPWNSLSLTLILWALVGFQWMLTFLLLSVVIAVISGLIFEQLVKSKILPKNSHTSEISKNFHFWQEAQKCFKNTKFTAKFWREIVTHGLGGSRMILRWIFFGVILASLIRTFVSPEQFETYFGPTFLGLLITVGMATILEVCSEGSTPIAADILTRAKSPGGAFAFLMTGVSTDYTEIMSLREATKSWKIAFFLPLVTLPQILLLAWILNQGI